MGLARYEIGRSIVEEERWHGLLWSAVPQRVVSSSAEQLVTWTPCGTVATRASNRDFPQAAGLTREDRKLLALRTREAVVAEVAEWPHKLSVFQPGRWSRVNLGWEPGTGRFLGWYVNFQLPPEPTEDGLATMDLVLDIWVDPDGSWRWKDRDDFDRAIADGIHQERIRAELDAETQRVLAELDQRTAAFDPRWIAFRPDPDWSRPELPAAYAWNGANWSLPPGRRIELTR
jgi:hypothetical protein